VIAVEQLTLVGSVTNHNFRRTEVEPFVYSNEKPSQLAYYTGNMPSPTGIERLDVHIFDDVGLARAIRMIRARAFGSIPAENFLILSWTDARLVGTPVFAPASDPSQSRLFHSQEPLIYNKGYVDDTGADFLGFVL
jgi:hypothetical protein